MKSNIKTVKATIKNSVKTKKAFEKPKTMPRGNNKQQWRFLSEEQIDNIFNEDRLNEPMISRFVSSSVNDREYDYSAYPDIFQED